MERAGNSEVMSLGDDVYMETTWNEEEEREEIRFWSCDEILESSRSEPLVIIHDTENYLMAEIEAKSLSVVWARIHEALKQVELPDKWGKLSRKEESPFKELPLKGLEDLDFEGV